MLTPTVKCWHTPVVSNSGERLDALMKASGLTRPQIAEKIGSSRGMLDYCVRNNRPPRDRDQYRKLIEFLGEDPFTPMVTVGESPAVPIDELRPDQVLDLLARLLRNPDFASALANRLSRSSAEPFGILGDTVDTHSDGDRANTDDGPENETAAQA